MLNHQLNPIGYCGISIKGRTFLIKSYLSVKVTVRCFHLNIAKLSCYQYELHNKIKELINATAPSSRFVVVLGCSNIKQVIEIIGKCTLKNKVLLEAPRFKAE